MAYPPMTPDVALFFKLAQQNDFAKVDHTSHRTVDNNHGRMEIIAMTSTATPRTPDKEVAQNILLRFRDSNLLPPYLLTPTLSAQLAAGSLRAEDWRLLAEKAQELAHRGSIVK